MEMIPFGDIKVNNKYLRIGSKVSKLKDSIEAVGLINPLVINANNELIAGGRRYTAIQELGWENAPCFRVDENELKQELISIDENLVRQNLTDTELENCLRRGKEIYEQLHPDTVEEITLEDLKPKPPKKKLNEEELKEELDDAFTELKKKTFVQDVAEKTGMTETSIKRAILRDIEASNEVKEARMSGEIGASHVNELIKLKKETQEQILPYIKDKAANLVKEIVKDVEKEGIEVAIEKTMNFQPITKEFIAVKNTAKRLNRLAVKIMAQGEIYNGPERDDAVNELIMLKNTIDEMIQAYSEAQEEY